MNFLRKFYNTEATDTGGAVAVEQPSIAELMAKSGYNSEDRPEQNPVENTGNNEQEVETKVESQAATVGGETKVETVVQEAEKPTETVQVEQSKAVAEEVKPTTVSWQEVLKQQQPDTVLKELLGVDDSKLGFIKELKELPPEMAKFLDTWKNKGDISAYLKEWTTDYSKMSAEDVMRNQLKADYPEASEKAIDALFKRKVIDSYNLDTEKYSDEEVEEGRLLLDAEADRYRKVLIEKQKAYVLPTPSEAKPIEQDNSEAEAATRYEAYKSSVINDPYTKSLFSNKQITIGEGTEAFNYPVEPTEVADILFNNEKWLAAINNVTVDAKGDKVYTPDVEKQMLLGAVAKYGKAFLNEYAKHFKALGGKSVIDPLENAKPITPLAATESQTKPASAAEAMAKSGVIR